MAHRFEPRQVSPPGMLLSQSRRVSSPIVVSIALLTLAGCTPNPTGAASLSGLCNEEAAQRLVGGTKPADAEAMRATGASIVRQIAPGQPVTEDYRDNRVTIETDPTSGRVVRARCG